MISRRDFTKVLPTVPFAAFSTTQKENKDEIKTHTERYGKAQEYLRIVHYKDQIDGYEDLWNEGKIHSNIIFIEDYCEGKPNGKEWYKNGRLHNENGPAKIDEMTHYLTKERFTEEWWYKDGLLHREYGPAIILNNGQIRKWYLNDKLHRENGPAVEFFHVDGCPFTKMWYINDMLEKEEHFVITGKIELSKDGYVRNSTHNLKKDYHIALYNDGECYHYEINGKSVKPIIRFPKLFKKPFTKSNYDYTQKSNHDCIDECSFYLIDKQPNAMFVKLKPEYA